MKLNSRLTCVIILLTGWLNAAVGLAFGDELLRWKFQQGKKFSHIMKKETTIEGVTSSLILIVDSSWSVRRVDAKGNGHIRLEVDRVRMSVPHSPDISVQLDTANPLPQEGPAVPQALQAITKLAFDIVLSPLGEVMEVKVDEELANDLQSVNRDMPGALITPEITPEDLVYMIQEGMPSFPDQPVSKGETWNRKITINSPKIKVFHFWLSRADEQREIWEIWFFPQFYALWERSHKFTYRGQEQLQHGALHEIDVEMELQMKEPRGGFGLSSPSALNNQSSEGTIYFDNDAGHVTEIKITHEVTIVGSLRYQQKWSQVITASLIPDRN